VTKVNLNITFVEIFEMIDFTKILTNELSMDPANWEEQRKLAHEMVDVMMDLHQFISDEPIWKEIPNAVKTAFEEPLPQSTGNARDVFQEFKQNILPYPKGNIHPRFWSWVQGTGSPTAMMADMLASGLNSNVTIGEHSAMYVDNQVINWMKELMNFPSSASGILLSGASMANVTGITIARNAFEDRNIREKGLSQQNMGKLVMYISAETHSCVIKAGEIVGIGNDQIRIIPVDKDWRMDMQALEKQFKIDTDAGFSPFCLVGNAGTVNTAAIDPLDDQLAFCREHGLWYHVDGAFGALAKLVPEYADQLKAIEHADSLAFDLHKWMYLPYEVACLLVKDSESHRKAFALQPSYLKSHERGLASGPDPITNFGFELSRGFKALKVWMSLKEHGLPKYAAAIRQNIAQTFYFESLLNEYEDVEIVAPATLNIVCYRYNPKDCKLTNDELNILNKELLMDLQEQGIAAPSYTFIHDKYVIRMCNVNHRSRKVDFQVLAEATIKLGVANKTKFFKDR
jgi:glutamate/tyrosine decarboxylase-like PLP-dependent enzyme